MDKFQVAVLIVFALLGGGLLTLAGLELLIGGHLPFMQIALGGGLIVLTIGGAALSGS